MYFGFFFRILTLLNKRELEKLKEKWWRPPPDLKCDQPEDQSEGISIQNIGGVFIVIFVGIGMACLTLVFEYWWYKKYRKNPKIIDVNEATNPKDNTAPIGTGVILGRQSKNEKSNAALRTRAGLKPRY